MSQRERSDGDAPDGLPDELVGPIDGLIQASRAFYGFLRRSLSREGPGNHEFDQAALAVLTIELAEALRSVWPGEAGRLPVAVRVGIRHLSVLVRSLVAERWKLGRLLEGDAREFVAERRAATPAGSERAPRLGPVEPKWQANDADALARTTYTIDSVITPHRNLLTRKQALSATERLAPRLFDPALRVDNAAPEAADWARILRDPEWRILQGLESLQAFGPATRVTQSMVIERACLWDHKRSHVQIHFRNLHLYHLIDSRKRLGTSLTPLGLAALRDRLDCVA
jgi:hypothetical protein